MGDTQRKKVSKLAAPVMLSALSAVHSKDLRGVYDTAHRNKKFRRALGLGVYESAVQLAKNTYNTVIASYKKALRLKNKLHARMLLSIAVPLKRATWASYKALADVFGCSLRQIHKAKMHALQFGAGMPAKLLKIPRQRLSVATAMFLTAFTVDREVVHRPAHSPNQVVVD
jgi:hypothetical protein